MKPSLIFGLVFTLAAIAGIAFCGYKLGEIRTLAAQSGLHDSIATLEREKSALQLAVAEQNAATLVAEAKARAAELAQQKAEEHAGNLALLSQQRMKKLDDALDGLQDSAEVLKYYWESRQ